MTLQLQSTTPEQRAGVYESVKSLIYPGFLTHYVSLNDTRVIFRTLSDDEWAILRLRTWGTSTRDWRAWFVASSMWMVDGQVVFGDQEGTYRLYEMCKNLPIPVLDELESVVGALMGSIREAGERVEGFIYEAESRLLWRVEKERVVQGLSYNGVRFGSNAIRRLWVFFNTMEDEREAEDYAWSLAKFAASPHAPKGVNKITGKDNQRARERKEQRQRTLDRIYYEAIGVLQRSNTPQKSDAALREMQGIKSAHTVEELQDEMRRWVAGIKDDHDTVVDGVKNKIRRDVTAREEYEKQRQQQLAEALEDEGVVGSQMIPLTGEAGQALIERLKNRVHGTTVYDGLHRHNSAYDKYLRKDPVKGAIDINEKGEIVSSTPDNPDLINLLTKPQSETSLDAVIRARKPTADLGDVDPE